MIIRSFKKRDAEALLKVFLSSVQDIASRDYSQEQIAAWIPDNPESIEQWLRHISALNPFVAEIDHQIIGYADLQPCGLIDHFYVSGMYARQGAGTQLMAHIEAEARKGRLSALTAFVSLTAEPFFLHHGFCVVKRCSPVRRGVILSNTLMRKSL